MLTKTLSKEHVCPKCKTSISKQVPLRDDALIKYILFWTPLKRYWCSNCRKRSYRMGAKDGE